MADIDLGKGVTISGFIDMAYVYQDVDGLDSTTKTYAIDQVETTIAYTLPKGITAQVDIEYGESGDGSGNDETFIEQAIIAMPIGDRLTVKAGRFLSYSGWETEEPTGLYQYSGTGYAPLFYGYYQQGLSAYYDGDTVDFMFSAVNDAFSNPIENDTTNLGTEVGVAISPFEGLTTKLFYITEEDKEAINFWTSYQFSSWTLAFEYNTAEDTAYIGSEADGYLLMANYATGPYGFTARYHDYEVEDNLGATTTDTSAVTLAASYAFSENLLIVGEYRMDSEDLDSDGDADTFALELLLTF